VYTCFDLHVPAECACRAISFTPKHLIMCSRLYACRVIAPQFDVAANKSISPCYEIIQGTFSCRMPAGNPTMQTLDFRGRSSHKMCWLLLLFHALVRCRPLACCSCVMVQDDTMPDIIVTCWLLCRHGYAGWAYACSETIKTSSCDSRGLRCCFHVTW
jgi:hypothetical protein